MKKKESKMKKEEKTNVMRVLDSKKIKYKSHNYVATEAIAGDEVAKTLGQDPNAVFKTLVTVSKSKSYYVFLVPVSKELDLKKAAKAVGEKKIEMLKSKELLPLTGYIHGGCSPIGMKKEFPTYIDESCYNHERISISAGQRGRQVLIAPKDLVELIHAEAADLTQK